MIREKRRTVTPVNLDFNAKIHNRFDIEVRDAVTGEIKQRAQAFNVICNALWTRMFTPTWYFSYIVYGSGSGTPAATDTILFNKINAIEAGNQVFTVNDASSDSVVSLRKSIVIGTEISNGETITEVGISYDGTNIVTHAMLQDMNGNPVSITKTSTDIITIYSTIYLHYISRSNNFIISAKAGIEANNFMSIILGNYGFGDEGFTGCVHNCWDGGGFGSYNTRARTIDASNKTVTYSIRFGVDTGNADRGLSGVQLDCIRINSDAFNLSQFAISGETIATGDGTKTEFDTSFPIKSNAKIYVDGVEQITGVSVNTGTDLVFDTIYESLDSDFNLIPYSYNWPNYQPIIFHNGNRQTFSGVSYWVTSGSIGQRGGGISIDTSTDGTNWTTIYSRYGYENNSAPFVAAFDQAVDSEYIRITAHMNNTAVSNVFLISPSDKTCDIIFSTPPAAGAVITADYVPDCIPKDSNHVFDVTVTITLGEYVGN